MATPRARFTRFWPLLGLLAAAACSSDDVVLGEGSALHGDGSARAGGAAPGAAGSAADAGPVPDGGSVDASQGCCDGQPAAGDPVEPSDAGTLDATAVGPSSCAALGGSCLARVATAACADWSEQASECGPSEGCCLSTPPDAGAVDSGVAPAACEAAGGTCVSMFATIACARWGSSADYDCGGDTNIGCCLP